MNSAEYFISHKVSSWVFALILGLGGAFAFFGLGQLEDPPFTIKEAMVITSYPGASAQQVEEEVTYPLENQIQQLAWVDKVKSISSPGLSQITVEIKSIYAGDALRQIWDELRRKITDHHSKLPPGVNTPWVNDDFGDVFGVLLAITGDGYNYEELNDYTDFLRRELVLVDGVSKVNVSGNQREQVNVEISRIRLNTLGISLDRIYDLLATQNVVSNAGSVRVGSEYIRISPTGEFNDVSELGRLIISEAGSSELIRLADVAEIKRGYAEIPDNLVSYNGNPALHLGISFTSGVNVVEVGKAITAKLTELEYARPIGMEIFTLYNQPTEVDNSVSNFLYNLLAAVAIVAVVLLVFMGIQSGLLISSILMLTILGTFIFMQVLDINLQRISLGALIIALGMLVDNAIVVTEGIIINIKRGYSRLEAAKQVVTQNQWPLLGATIIAVIAFAPIGLSPDATGEFAGSLFWVLLISLMLSWVTAITLTPFFCHILFKENDIDAETDAVDPYKGFIFTIYKALLDLCMRWRLATIVVVIVATMASIAGFSQVRQAFFPPSTTAMFLVDYWRIQGTDIRATAEDMRQLENWLLTDERIEYVATTTGQGAQRFMLTYGPEKQYAAYGQLMVRTVDNKVIDAVLHDLDHHLKAQFAEAEFKLKRLEIGPSTDAKIELRISGADPDVLRGIAAQAADVFREDPSAINIRHDWRERTKLIRPQFLEAQARRAGISKQDLDSMLQMNFSGETIGLYRDGTTLLPIIARTPDKERLNIDNLQDLTIWSPRYQNWVPVDQVVGSFDVVWEDSLIIRRDRKRTLTLMTDPNLFSTDTAAALLTRIKPQIEQINLPTGYSIQWGGEYESSRDAQKPIFTAMPLGFLAMFLITISLFNSVRKPLVIWATVPLAITGVTLGLLALDLPFGFMAMLGFLSLSGMLLKNGIVLLDQINIELDSGKEPYAAVFESAVSRVRPVCMAAITTILGMIPLLFDDFFASMAVVISFGLGVATVLTLIVVPVLYAMAYRIKYRSPSDMRDI
ncbi:efflux RND transporter permease subunit [Neptuniibacter caesariensis]|uniref:Cation/multidrug efflux pump n=1 Tax=Neptuniibacter caesariensis TaxID=207954 RepID=A0A7U8C4D2_NEPCE|nr:efflux RND transporter permease subunit [Neptuniibacter caesariensis]EAR61323.1 Cation/multidrug efflux pump [Oceanospirillum sp. MED92] [Neptuniibacter caesariensis]